MSYKLEIMFYRQNNLLHTNNKLQHYELAVIVELCFLFYSLNAKLVLVKCESYVTVTGIINVSYFHATLTKARHKIEFSETKARD